MKWLNPPIRWKLVCIPELLICLRNAWDSPDDTMGVIIATFPEKGL